MLREVATFLVKRESEGAHFGHMLERRWLPFFKKEERGERRHVFLKKGGHWP